MRQHYRLAIWAIFAFFLCTIACAASPRPHDLTGTVKDGAGHPVAGATVFVYTAKQRVGTSPFCPSCYADCGKHEQTNSHGAFRIRSLAGTLLFRILVVKDGYDSKFVRNVDPFAGLVNVSLARTVVTPSDRARTVAGRVVDPDNRPVVGATIETVGVGRIPKSWMWPL